MNELNSTSADKVSRKKYFFESMLRQNEASPEKPYSDLNYLQSNFEKKHFYNEKLFNP